MFLSLLVVVGKVRRKTLKDFFGIPSFVNNKGKEFEETTTERRNLWISAVNRDDDQETWSWQIRVKSS